MIIEHKGVWPVIDETAFIESTAVVAGDVEIGPYSSIWFYSVVRGDVNYVRIGERTNIQDGSIVHVTLERWPCIIGSETTLGHRALAHGCTIGDRCLIGMGAIVLDGAEVGDGSIVAAGAVVPPGMKVPPGKLAAGVPAKIIRDVKETDLHFIREPLEQYIALSHDYKDRNSGR